MHTEIKAICCVARVFLGLGFLCVGGVSIYVNPPVEAATIRSEVWLLWPLVFLGQTVAVRARHPVSQVHQCSISSVLLVIAWSYCNKQVH